MKRGIAFVVVGLVYAGLMALAAGCAAKNGEASMPADHQGHHGMAMSQPTTAPAAMMCPKCETVWIPELTDQGTKVQRFAWGKKMTCPECDAMAVAQLTGDNTITLHDCPTCKVAPQPLSKAPAPPLLHPRGTH